MLLESDALIAQAVARTGLTDFGSTTFREGLNRLVESLNQEAFLNEVWRARVEGSLVQRLSNRLRVEDWWARHPQLSDEVVDRPLIIVGMSRSGTTALSHLLAQDAGLRSLLQWEATDSAPPPQAASYAADPRFLQAIEAEEHVLAAMPGLQAMHHDPPDAPVECNQLLAHDFNSSAFWTVYAIPSYWRWTLTTAPTSSYAYHARMLKLLQSAAPGRWSLKGPQHGMALESLRAEYANASFIVTHRDPAICTASTASLIAYFNRLTSTKPRPDEAGALTTEFIELCARGLVDYADGRGDGAMIHVAYTELIRDPMAVVRRIYDGIGRDLTPEVKDAMEMHLKRRPQNKHGVHRYELAEFALDRGDLDERFRAYRERFDVAREAR